MHGVIPRAQQKFIPIFNARIGPCQLSMDWYFLDKLRFKNRLTWTGSAENLRPRGCLDVQQY